MKETVLTKAKAAGVAAFHTGKRAAPAQDAALMRLLTPGAGATIIQILDAWLAGWHGANAAAPVPGVTDTPEWLAGRS